MAAYVGRAVRVTALPAVHAVGNPVRVVAPHAFYARFDSEGNVLPVRLGVVTDDGLEWLTPPI